ncbi:MAG: hypothetical protein WDM79_08400 [Terricaulis sp.]
MRNRGRIAARRQRAAQGRLHQHRVSIGAIGEERGCATRAQTIVGAHRRQLDTRGRLDAVDERMLKLSMESVGTRGPLGAIALLGGAMGNDGHRDSCCCDTRDCRRALAHSQRVLFNFYHDLGP